MFDYVTNSPTTGSRTARVTITFVSGVAHAVIAVLLVAVPFFFVGAVPEVPGMMTFVVSLPPQPPPPPPPPAGAPTPPQPVRRAQPRETQPARVLPTPDVAPIEAPSELGEEAVVETGASDSPETSGGVPGGVEGGVPGGVIGGVVGGLGRMPPPPPAPAPALVRVGGNITPPRLLHRVAAEYPTAAVLGRVEGIVVLEAVVNTQGQVESVRALRSHRLLEDAAIAAVEQWQYEPLVMNGVSHPFVLTVTVSFSLT